MSVSDIVIESSLHGRERRIQRDISKRDLQAAVKYGTRSPGRPRRNTGEATWLYEFADITFVTDSTGTREITAWAKEIPITEVPISDHVRNQHAEACRRINEDKSIITSHYVFVVDMSSSMRNSDMNGHRNRFRCVYYTLAELFALDAIKQSRAFSGTDVVTLIEMHRDATIVFELEPISMVLYNRFIQLALRPVKLAAFDHGNFLPSLKKAVSIHLDRFSSTCAPSVYFFTDGKPSDPTTDATGAYRGVLPTEKFSHFGKILREKMRPLFQQLKGNLSFTACGFGGNGFDFDVLEELVEEAKQWGVKASFVSGDVKALSTSLLSLVSSTTETRTMLSRLSFSALGKEKSMTRNSAEKMQARESSASDTFDASEWRLYSNAALTTCGQLSNPRQGLLSVERYTIKYVRAARHTYYKKIPFLDSGAVGIAVHRKYFGEGAERVVFEMHELAAGNKPVGIPLVAKESKWAMQKEHWNMEKFHFKFVKTQKNAARLACVFSRRLDDIGVDRLCVPRITFLDCSIYYCNGGKEEFLVEQRLNPLRYVKWNDNAGGVDGKPKPVLFNIAPAKATEEVDKNLDIIEEGDEDDEDDEDDGSDEDEGLNVSTIGPTDPRVAELQRKVIDSDLPQAFSHWTHVYSKRNLMVCDLQGELVEADGSRVFMMTDPCIHRASRSEYRGHRDRTDKGRRGMESFFQTHKCNTLCEILGINPQQRR